MDVLLNHPGLLVGLSGLLGLLIGSFLNVVIVRLPKMLQNEWAAQCKNYFDALAPEKELTSEADQLPLSLTQPRSHCTHCGHIIRAYENIPVISFIFLGAKCSACKAPISWRYPLIELLTAVLFCLVTLKFGASIQTVAGFFFVSTLIALAGIDADTQLLPDDLTLSLLWVGLLINAPLWHGQGLFVSLVDAVLGAALGYLILWLTYWGFKLITGKEGMGYGDFKLLAALGAWFGWQALPMMLLYASLAGASVGLVLIALSRLKRGQPLPFGPYLAAAGLLTLFYGPVGMINWVLR